MDDQQKKTVDALKYAIQMENDGKQFYEKAYKESTTKIGKDLFQWLVEQEDKHIERFKKIFESITNNEAWPEIDSHFDGKAGLQTLFANALDTLDRTIKASPSEIDAIKIALEMENKSMLYYHDRGQESAVNMEKAFYASLAAEERGHYLTLADYREYLVDPEGWFTIHEHHSLDAG